MDIYIVKPGDTFWKIARAFGVNMQRLISDNGLTEDSTLSVGQSLLIQYPTETYKVQPQDTLFSVARKFEIAPLTLIRNNSNLEYPYPLMTGEEIVISYDRENLRGIETNGYAYPYIKEEVLRNTSPFLSNVLSFSYGYSVTGELIPLADEELIRISSSYGSRPFLVLSNVDEEQSFSSDRVHLLLSDQTIQKAVIESVMKTMEDKGFMGLDIDLEYILPEDKELYLEFLRRITSIAHQEGYPVYAALAPKTSAEQAGVLYEAHDYQAVGEIVDGVLLMTYEWGYLMGPPLPVSPVDKVRDVLDYAVTVIPPEKIFLGMPNYGYDWTLPYVRGTSARTVSNMIALELAVEYHAQIEFDTQSQSPYFTYWDEDKREHIVWFQDARSIHAMALLVQEYGLRGVGVWNIMNEYSPLWLILNQLYDITMYQ